MVVSIKKRKGGDGRPVNRVDKLVKAESTISLITIEKDFEELSLQHQS